MHTVTLFLFLLSCGCSVALDNDDKAAAPRGSMNFKFGADYHHRTTEAADVKHTDKGFSMKSEGRTPLHSPTPKTPMPKSPSPQSPSPKCVVQ